MSSVAGPSWSGKRTRRLNPPTPKRTHPISDTIRCLKFRMKTILIGNYMRYSLREAVCADLFVRLCSVWCDMIVQPCKCFPAYGTVFNVSAGCDSVSFFLPCGCNTVCPIASATLRRDSAPGSVYISKSTIFRVYSLP